MGELLRSAEIAIQYGARVARDIASDPDCDRDAGTVVIVIDAFGAEIARLELKGGGAMDASQAQAARRARRREGPQSRVTKTRGFGPSWPADQVEAQAVRVLGLEGEPQNGIPFNLRYSRFEAISSSLENCSLNRAASS